jgi:hypothetical protein
LFFLFQISEEIQKILVPLMSRIIYYFKTKIWYLYARKY